MEKYEKRRKKGLIWIIILLISLIITVCDFVLVDFDLFYEFKFHELFTFVFCIAVGFGGYSLIGGIVKERVFGIFIGSVSIMIGMLYALLGIAVNLWLLWVIVAIVLFVITAIISFIKVGNKTEDIALNKREGYKKYGEREKKGNDQTEELPEIKSFK